MATWRFLGLFGGLILADAVQAIVGIPDGFHGVGDALALAAVALLCVSIGLVAVTLIGSAKADSSEAPE